MSDPRFPGHREISSDGSVAYLAGRWLGTTVRILSLAGGREDAIRFVTVGGMLRLEKTYIFSRRSPTDTF